jgi:hypothetical protein
MIRKIQFFAHLVISLNLVLAGLRCGLGFATDAIGRRIAGLLVASDWAAFVVFFIAEFVKIN